MKAFSDIACSYLTEAPHCCGRAPKDVMQFRPGSPSNPDAHFQCEECGSWMDIADMEIGSKMKEVFFSSEYSDLLSSIEPAQKEVQAVQYMGSLPHMQAQIRMLEHANRELRHDLHQANQTIAYSYSQNNDLISALSQSEDEKSELLITLNASSKTPTPEASWKSLASPSKSEITPPPSPPPSPHPELPWTFEKQLAITARLTNISSYNVKQLFTHFAAASVDGVLNRHTYNNTFREIIKKSPAYKTFCKDTIEFLVDKIFVSLDQNNTGTISTWDLICGLTTICAGSKHDKLAFLFSQSNLTRHHLEQYPYSVDLQKRTCDCPDFTYRCKAHNHLTCKHLRSAYKYQMTYQTPTQTTIANGHIHIHDMFVYLRALYKVMYVIDNNMRTAMGLSACELAKNDSVNAFKYITTDAMTFSEFCRNPS
jgi:hypothetical protein